MAQFGLEAFIPRQHKAHMKRQLIKEWNNECAYCGHKQRHKELTIDHIIPITKQGTDEYFNLVPACRSCNLSKGDSGIRQWYFDSEDFSSERWLKIKQHMVTDNVLAA
jgi:Restriction endonuclease